MSWLGGFVTFLAIAGGALVVTTAILLSILWYWLRSEEQDLASRRYLAAKWILP